MVLIEREKGDDKGANQKFVDLETQKIQYLPDNNDFLRQEMDSGKCLKVTRDPLKLWLVKCQAEPRLI